MLSKTILDILNSEDINFFEKMSDEVTLVNQLLKDYLNSFEDKESRLELLRTLYIIQDEELRNPLDRKIWLYDTPYFYNIKNTILKKWESGWISNSKLDVNSIPNDPKEFARWLRRYCSNHKLFEHPILDVLKKGSIETFKNYFYYGSMLDTPQVELYARATVGLPDESPRIEISKNYWDEMGLGEKSECHGVWSEKFLSDIGLLENPDSWEVHFYKIPEKCLERFIVAQYVTLYRKNWLESIGHLGATEIYDPILNVKITQLGRNFGFSDNTLKYFIEHVKVDAIHSRDWLNKVVIPLCQEDNSLRIGIARGAEMNLEAHYRAFDELFEILQLEDEYLLIE